MYGVLIREYDIVHVHCQRFAIMILYLLLFYVCAYDYLFLVHIEEDKSDEERVLRLMERKMQRKPKGVPDSGDGEKAEKDKQLFKALVDKGFVTENEINPNEDASDSDRNSNRDDVPDDVVFNPKWHLTMNDRDGEASGESAAHSQKENNDEKFTNFESEKDKTSRPLIHSVFRRLQQHAFKADNESTKNGEGNSKHRGKVEMPRELEKLDPSSGSDSKYDIEFTETHMMETKSSMDRGKAEMHRELEKLDSSSGSDSKYDIEFTETHDGDSKQRK